MKRSCINNGKAQAGHFYSPYSCDLAYTLVPEAEGRQSDAPSPLVTLVKAFPYFTGTIRCSYGLPGHITYGFVGSGSVVF